MEKAKIRELYTAFENAHGVSTDSRELKRGSLFFALHGDSFDGNQFAAQALERGAALAVVDDKSVAISERYLLVEDTLVALQQLAQYHRQKLQNIHILAITGSNGKTTTKELIARVLEQRYSALVVTNGNLNNHIGVPLTILEMDQKTQFGVVEMGASAIGEIARLCEIAQPNYGLITNIGRAHLEGFGSIEGVIKGKGELLDYLEEYNGVVLYLEQDRALSQMVEQHKGLQKIGYSIDLAYGVNSRLTGSYNRANIAAALAVGEYFKIDRAVAVEAVSQYIPSNMRSQRVETGLNSVFMDCYNANPSSMESALDNFAQERGTQPKVAILGDMLELGDYASAEHIALLEGLKERDIDRVFLVGELFTKALSAIPLEVRQKSGVISSALPFKDTSALLRYFEKQPIKGSQILLKGSRSVELDLLMRVL